MEVLTYEEIVEQIENKRRFGNQPGVEVTAYMLRRLNNPQEGLPIIHIAGTNGKGSVSAFLCSILKEAGLRVGMFTSPHLVDFRERICVDGEMIGREDVRRIGERLLAEETGVCPTMFDYCLLMGILYFREKKCDVAVIETGLGGRLDSTNALGVPVVSVITKIGYDHMAILGETLAEIAAEKAGIIKQGTRLVLESQEGSAESVLLEKAEAVGVSTCQIIETAEIRMEGRGRRFSFRKYQGLSMKMLGIHQYENAVAAILAAEEFFLSEVTVKVEEEQLIQSVRAGVEKTFWKGRMEVLRQTPFLMVDGAHNRSGVDALKDSLLYLFPGEKFHFIMGVMADKDYEDMVETLLPLAIDFRTVTAAGERALPAHTLAEYICKRGVFASCCEDLGEYLLPERGDPVHKTVAFGSLYFIGEIEEMFLDKTLQNHYNSR